MNNQNTISIDISNYLRKLIQSGEKIPAKLSFISDYRQSFAWL